MSAIRVKGFPDAGSVLVTLDVNAQNRSILPKQFGITMEFPTSHWPFATFDEALDQIKRRNGQI